MHTILTHFQLDSIFHSVFGGIGMLPEHNQSFGRSVQQRKKQVLRKPVSIPAQRLSPVYRPAEGVGRFLGRRLRLGGKRGTAVIPSIVIRCVRFKIIPGPRLLPTDCAKTPIEPRRANPQTHRLRMLKIAKGGRRQSRAIRVRRNCLWHRPMWPSENMAVPHASKNPRHLRPHKSQVRRQDGSGRSFGSRCPRVRNRNDVCAFEIHDVSEIRAEEHL